MPVLAVTAGGKSWVNTGSTRATCGTMLTLRILALTPCVSEVSTALRVTSDPVPAVVGIASMGSDGLAIGWPRPTTSI